MIKIALMILLLFATSGCVKEKKADTRGYKKVYIGIIAPVTGKNRRFFSPSILGVAWAKQVAGVIKEKKVVLVYDVKDTHSTKNGALQALREFAKDKKYVAVISFMSSGRILALQKSIEKLHIPFVATLATSNHLVAKDGYITQVCMTNQRQALVASHYIHDEKLIESVGVVYNATNSYSKELATQFSQNFSKIGGHIVFFKDVHNGKTLRQLPLDKKPLIIYDTSSVKTTLKLLQDIHEHSLKTKIFGSDGLLNEVQRNYKHEMSLFDGVLLVEHYASNQTTSKKRRQFVKFLEKKGMQENSYSLLAYDAFILIRDAIVWDNNPSRENINKEVRNSKTIDGVYGKFFTQHGKIKREIYVDTIQDAKLYKEVIIY